MESVEAHRLSVVKETKYFVRCETHQKQFEVPKEVAEHANGAEQEIEAALRPISELLPDGGVANNPGPRKYVCADDGREFDDYQGYGGHRAWHRRRANRKASKSRK